MKYPEWTSLPIWHKICPIIPPDRRSTQHRDEPDLTTRLIIVDEADRLKMAGLEQMKDIYDQSELGLILIGMPGIEKRLSRYPQLYSRVGFVHQFHSLSSEELRFIMGKKMAGNGFKL